ncbi:MAG: hypothetical protein WCG37_00075 [Actinomycetes bacterium]
MDTPSPFLFVAIFDGEIAIATITISAVRIRIPWRTLRLRIIGLGWG